MSTYRFALQPRHDEPAPGHHWTMLPPRNSVCVWLAIIFLWPLCLPAQSPPEGGADNALPDQALPNASPAAHCAALSAGNPALLPMSKLCEFAASYLHKIPDFICEQTTSSQSTRGFRSPTVMRARVTYQDGRDTYSDVVVNEMPMETHGAAPLGMNRVATAGEFGSDLVGLFKPPVAAEFRFRKEARIGSQAALVFDFHVPAAKNHFWTAGSSKGTFNPELRGELWVRPQDARLLRIKIEPLHLPSDFPIISSTTTVDYGEVSLSEAGVFLLPVYSESEPCLRVSRGFAEDGCVRNKTWFYKCRKFRAKARIIGEPELQ